ncbi:MAG: BON domain-containing protein [Verrucomicrobia bacterium]|nr:BON domain-containing protein [Verrucomicrobiota bacterium]
MSPPSFLLRLCAFALCLPGVWALDTTPTPTPTPPDQPTPPPPTLPAPSLTPTPKPIPAQPDNAGRNQRARRGSGLVATDQSNQPDDLRVTRELRRAVLADTSLSLNAKNVKIISTSALLVLRGLVDSPSERTRLDALAQTAAGSRQVVNELEVRARP